MSVTVFGYTALALFAIVSIAYLYLGYRIFIKNRKRPNTLLEIIKKVLYLVILFYVIYMVVISEGLIIMMVVGFIFQTLGI